MPMSGGNAAASAQPYLLVGGYTAGNGGRADGLTLLAPGPEGYAVASVAAVDSPSFVAAHPRLPGVVVAVTETAPAEVLSFRIADGRITELSRVDAQADFACHVAPSPSGRLVVVAGYGSGSVSSFPLDDEGRLGACRDVVRFAGSGPDAERQDAPHAHQVRWVPTGGPVADPGDAGRAPGRTLDPTGMHDTETSGRALSPAGAAAELLVCDLGTDRVHRLTVDGHGRFSVAEPVRLPPGSGPRHALLLGSDLLVACELSAELWVGRSSGDTWTEVQRLPSSGAPAGAHVQPSAIVLAEVTAGSASATTGPEPAGASVGPYVLVANRGVGTVAVFARSPDGWARVGEFAAGGSWPRDLTVADGRVWVANERDHRIDRIDLVELVDPVNLMGPVDLVDTAQLPDPPSRTSVPAGSPTCVVVLTPEGRPVG